MKRHVGAERGQLSIGISPALRGPDGGFAGGSVGVTMFAPTWSVGAAGFGTVADVRDAVRDLVDKFANDWLAANPLNGKT